MQESFYRPDSELLRTTRTLPAAIYNLAHTLLAQSQTGCVFVPIRTMQYMAVLDKAEFIFVDRERPGLIELAWQSFHPGSRIALEDPVPFDLVYYDKRAAHTMQRLVAEFYKALMLLSERRIADAPPAKILSFSRKC
ncbi:hypothetical protein TPL01_07430 [Sulfuriferula plumbiphila]|uniref:Uncharacterized protein n=1 Tax=Sulfuriferula plumbiphila TaxID=171865 RepID=A0A512L553_9PROT|nr:hypothetical protein [Sulfuriferula plumbiphila]BBP05836.1 hypothetical protein SFPGR_32580 [Sulfuriferula plumbiphila]GEP29605.1 hypothetical protein TPL01_07430 [Sulfuriferula plumbiphila]